jgi:two-component system, cell cycle response regulator
VDNDWDDTAVAIPGSHEIQPHLGPAYLIVVRGKNVGTRYQVLGPSMVIGRASGADIQLPDDGVSRLHCRLQHEPIGIMLEDLGSRNGTYCNGARVAAGKRKLTEGDRLQVGTTSVLVFTYDHVDETKPLPTVDGQRPSVRDPLTGACTRRYLFEQLDQEVTIAVRNRSALSLLLVHIDRFDDILANHGREYTDSLTICVVKHLRDSVRVDDMIARIAEGEFALMSRSASPGDTFMMAERLRTSSTGLTVPWPEGPAGVTLSLGVAALHELHIETANDLLVAAGTALHRARSMGGNRCVLCTQELLKNRSLRVKV